MLKINDLDKLKFTSITSVIHFKYDNEDYYIHENQDFTEITALYKGATIFNNEYIKGQYGLIKNLIKYKNNKKVLSAIDKRNFVKKLYKAEIIDIDIEDIKIEVKKEKKEYKEIQDKIRELQNRLNELDS